MSLHQLTIRMHANGYALVADIGKPTEHVIASRIQSETDAKLLAASPDLASAAIFAVQMLNAQGNDSLLHMACVKLINALGRGGIDMNPAQAEPLAAPEAAIPTAREVV